MDRQTNRQNYTNFEMNLAMMVIYVSVKYEFDWTNCFRVRVRKQKCGRTDGWTEKRTNGQTNRQNYTNFERNLVMMVIYVPVKYEFDWTNCFRVRVRKRKMWTNRLMDRQTDKKRTNEQTELHQFRKEASYDGDLQVKFEFDRTNRSETKNVDGQTDVRHINLIGGLVTCT